MFYELESSLKNCLLFSIQLGNKGQN